MESAKTVQERQHCQKLRITSSTDINGARSACSTCFSGTYCCLHARYEYLCNTELRRIVCICKGACRNA